MKKIFIILIFLIFSMTLVSAINFEMKDTFDQEEVLMAKLSGDFINPPLKQNIFFYRGHVRIAINPSIAKINEDYYVFAPLSGKTSANYSVIIEEVSYKKASKIIEEDLVKNFTITENLIDFIIDKGFVDTKDDFYIEIENLLDEDLELIMNITTISGSEGGINSYSEDYNHELVIEPGSERIEFEIDIQKPTTKLIHFSSENTSYAIPVSLFIDEQAAASKIFSFKIEPPEFDITTNITSQLKKFIYIYNTGTGTLKDIKLTLDTSLKPYVTISKDEFGQILPGKNAHLNLSVSSTGTDGKIISGDLIVEVEEQKLKDSIEITVKTKKGYIPSPEEQAPRLQTDDTCKSTGGKICTKEEECSETEFYALDDKCCPGVCKPKPGKSPLGKIIGWGLLIIIILAVIWFFLKKYKKVKKPVDLLKIAKGKK
jgi:hypothetical protein